MKKTDINSYQHTYLKYSNLVAGFYFPQAMGKTIIIIAQGALSPGDMGRKAPYEKISELNIPIIIPDYYGHFRSGGTFTPENCAKTIIETIRLARGEIKAYSAKERKYLNFKFDNIIVVGSSFGGWIPWYINSFFPKYTIDKIGLIAPLIDFQNQASARFPKEESNTDFLFLGKHFFSNTYRGIENPIWDKFLSGKDKRLNPMENLDKLANCEIAIVHGKEDSVIDYSKSENLYKKLKQLNSQAKYLKLIPNVGHSSDRFAEKIKFIVEKLINKN